MHTKLVINLAEFIKSGIRNHAQIESIVTQKFMSEIDISSILVRLQVWMESLGDRLEVNGKSFGMDEVFFHMYDVSSVKPERTLKVCIRFFKEEMRKVPVLNEDSSNEIFRIFIGIPDMEVSMCIGDEFIFSGNHEDLMEELSGQKGILKINIDSNGHVNMPISRLMTLEPTADMVLKLWQKDMMPEVDQTAVDVGRKLFNQFKSIYECKMENGRNNDKFNSNECYLVFVRKKCNGIDYDKIGIVKIEGNKPLYVINPEKRYDLLHPKRAVVSAYTNDFKSPVVEGTMVDVRKFFGGIQEG